jgi:hypothetical protein
MKQMGYLFVDHRASPGLTAEEARAVGFDPSMAGSKVIEADTMTCSHCKAVVVKNPLRQRERGFCLYCSHYICDCCAIAMDEPDYKHAPFVAKIELAYAQAAVDKEPPPVPASTTLAQWETWSRTQGLKRYG